MAMHAEVKGKHLIITIDLEKARDSSSGKTKIVASSGGGKETEATIDGRPVVVNLSAYYKPAK